MKERRQEQKNQWKKKPSKKVKLNEPPHDETNTITCVPSEEDSDQPGHLIRVFAVRFIGS